MEDEILEKAAELRDLILNSEEYTKLQLYRERLAKEEELYRKVTAVFKYTRKACCKRVYAGGADFMS